MPVVNVGEDQSKKITHPVRGEAAASARNLYAEFTCQPREASPHIFLIQSVVLEENLRVPKSGLSLSHPLPVQGPFHIHSDERSDEGEVPVGEKSPDHRIGIAEGTASCLRLGTEKFSSRRKERSITARLKSVRPPGATIWPFAGTAKPIRIRTATVNPSQPGVAGKVAQRIYLPSAESIQVNRSQVAPRACPGYIPQLLVRLQG